MIGYLEYGIEINISGMLEATVSLDFNAQGGSERIQMSGGGIILPSRC